MIEYNIAVAPHHWVPKLPSTVAYVPAVLHNLGRSHYERSIAYSNDTQYGESPSDCCIINVGILESWTRTNPSTISAISLGPREDTPASCAISLDACMAPGLIFLAGAPSEHELAQRIISPADLLPEFRVEELSLQRSWKNKTDTISLPAWTTIAPVWTTGPLHPSGNKRKRDENGSAVFLESQKIFADAIPPTQTLPCAEGSAIGSDLQSYLDTSLRLHELDVNCEMQMAEQRAHQLGLQSHLLKMSRVEITQLEDIPNAAHLRDIEPQTMTVNLIVGIISSPKIRSVYTTVAKRHVNLLELVVGDETRSGFAINIWLPQDKGVDAQLKQEACKLRQGQVVLFQNVALNSFKGRVYGQNLRRNLTRLALVHSHCVGEKISAVRNWMAEFVALGEPAAMDGSNRSGRLPPDTQ